jgi:hypothetical protein
LRSTMVHANGPANLHIIGFTFFNFYFYLLWFAALILLLVMVGSIILTVDFKYRSIQNNLYENNTYLKNNENKNRIKFWGNGY